MKNNDSGNEPKHSTTTDSALSASCTRAADLIAYLYDEASEAEAKSFAAGLARVIKAGKANKAQDALSAYGVLKQ